MTKITTHTLPGFMNGRGIGFDHLFDMFDNTSNISYPPYNIVAINDDRFVIEMAVAGISIEDIDITQDGNKLTICGKPTSLDDVEKDDIVDSYPTYLHKGISTRSFSREFALAEYVNVESAEMTNGILKVMLCREVPDEKKPRSINIKIA